MITGNDNTISYAPVGPGSILPSLLANLELVQPEEHQGVRILGAESQVCLLITCMLCARLLASLAPFLQVCANVPFSEVFPDYLPFLVQLSCSSNGLLIHCTVCLFYL